MREIINDLVVTRNFLRSAKTSVKDIKIHECDLIISFDDSSEIKFSSDISQIVLKVNDDIFFFEPKNNDILNESKYLHKTIEELTSKNIELESKLMDINERINAAKCILTRW